MARKIYTIFPIFFGGGRNAPNTRCGGGRGGLAEGQTGPNVGNIAQKRPTDQVSTWGRRLAHWLLAAGWAVLMIVPWVGCAATPPAPSAGGLPVVADVSAPRAPIDDRIAEIEATATREHTVGLRPGESLPGGTARAVFSRDPLGSDRVPTRRHEHEETKR